MTKIKILGEPTQIWERDNNGSWKCELTTNTKEDWHMYLFLVNKLAIIIEGEFNYKTPNIPLNYFN